MERPTCNITCNVTCNVQHATTNIATKPVTSSRMHTHVDALDGTDGRRSDVSVSAAPAAAGADASYRPSASSMQQAACSGQHAIDHVQQTTCNR